MATTWIKPLHVNKGKTIAQTLKDRLDYAENPDKTESRDWVTSYECDPLIADDEFLFSKNQYAAVTGRDQGERDVLAYHLRISFKPGETDAQTANKIGYDLALKLTKGNHAFVCCTHTDKHHMHSHVFINSTSIDCTKKFRNFKRSSFAIRRIADHLCLENGLSIIENPKPSRGSYADWQGDGKPQSNREKLERLIDAALENRKDYDAFIAAMIATGCEVKRGKHLAFKIPGAERFARCNSLGDDYSEEAILERLRGQRKVERPHPAPTPDTVFIPFVITAKTKFSLLIDIQKKIQEGKGEGYEHWARIYNLKQMGKTLIYMREVGIDSYDDLFKKSASASSDFNNRFNRIKQIESRQKEISELQKHIGTYGKTRDVYAQYRKSGWDKNFFEEHRAELTLHQATKKYFDDAGFGKNNPLPPMDSLKREWAMLQSEKKTLYHCYHDLKDQRTQLLTAKDNVERFLKLGQYAPEQAPARNPKSKNSHAR